MRPTGIKAQFRLPALCSQLSVCHACPTSIFEGCAIRQLEASWHVSLKGQLTLLS